MRLRTDDDIYRARLLYLGPPGYTLPIHLPYAQYGVFAALLALFIFVRWLFTFQIDLFPAIEIALALVATSLIYRYVDQDRPARAVVRTLMTDWRHTRESANENRDRSFNPQSVRIRPQLLERPARKVR